MPPPLDVILAADIGAGSLRAAAVDLAGRVRAIETCPLAIDEPAPGHAEADPEAWWRGVAAALGRLLARAPRLAPRALCLTGMTRSQVFLDAAGRAVRPAILWRDRRAESEAAHLAALVPGANLATAVNAFHPLARLAWLARAEPENFAATRAVLDPKDFLNARLTGIVAADAVTAARLDDLGALPASAPAALHRARALLDMPRVSPWAVLGEVAALEPPFDQLAGLPVVAGAMDTWAAAIGAGAAAPGLAYDVAGTSEAVGLVTAAPAAAPGLVTLPWTEGAHQLGGPTQAGGDAAAWAHAAFRVRGGLAVAVERAARLAPERGLPLFLPYLAGERAPVWRADVRGAFHGLDRAHDADALLFAVLEGVAGAVGDILATAEAGAGIAAAEIRVCGGGARSAAWCQLKANVLGRPVARPREIESGLVGCAAAAAVGLGLHADLAPAARAMAFVARIFAPDPALAGLFRDRAAGYARLKRGVLGEGA